MSIKDLIAEWRRLKAESDARPLDQCPWIVARAAHTELCYALRELFGCCGSDNRTIAERCSGTRLICSGDCSLTHDEAITAALAADKFNEGDVYQLFQIMRGEL